MFASAGAHHQISRQPARNPPDMRRLGVMRHRHDDVMRLARDDGVS